MATELFVRTSPKIMPANQIRGFAGMLLGLAPLPILWAIWTTTNDDDSVILLHALKTHQHAPSHQDPIPIPFQDPVHCTQVVPKQVLAWEPVKKGLALVGFKGV